MSNRKSRRTRGFTLIELMIVIAVILILMGVAIPQYQRSVLQAKETVLRQDLHVLRNAIDQYTLDKKKAPQSLQDIVSAGYLKEIPKDPITGSTETWETVQEDTLMAIDQQEPGIDDVHSGAQGNGSDGTAYNTW